MAATQAAENHGDEWGLTWNLQWGVYTSISTWNLSQNSVPAVEAPSLKIWKISQVITKAVSISMKIVVSCASLFAIEGRSMETEITTISEFPNGRKATVEQILVSEEISKFKRIRLRESQSAIRVGKLTIWVS